MNIKIPYEVDMLLRKYSFLLKESFGDNLVGVYLYNSVALGEFEEKKSDIDFITVFRKKPDTTGLQNLAGIHANIRKCNKLGSKMEGFYLTVDDIGKCNKDLFPYPYCTNGKLIKRGYYGLNSVTWLTLKKYEFTCLSTDIDEFNINIQWSDIVDNMSYNLNTYWKTKIDRRFIFLSDNWIEFGVLTLCRILYTLKNKDIISKRKAGEYALKVLPKEWNGIILEALRIRRCERSKLFYTSRFRREADVKRFITYITDYCNDNYIRA